MQELRSAAQALDRTAASRRPEPEAAVATRWLSRRLSGSDAGCPDRDRAAERESMRAWDGNSSHSSFLTALPRCRAGPRETLGATITAWATTQPPRRIEWLRQRGLGRR